MKGLIKVAATVLAVAALSACSSKHSKSAGGKKPQAPAVAEKSACEQTQDLVASAFEGSNFDNDQALELDNSISDASLKLEQGDLYAKDQDGSLTLSLTLAGEQYQSSGKISDWTKEAQFSQINRSNGSMYPVVYDVGVKALDAGWNQIAVKVCSGSNCSGMLFELNNKGEYNSSCGTVGIRSRIHIEEFNKRKNATGGLQGYEEPNTGTGGYIRANESAGTQAPASMTKAQPAVNVQPAYGLSESTRQQLRVKPSFTSVIK